MTQEDRIIELMKTGNWYSNYAMQQHLKSSSADRVFRHIREKGVEGFKFESRKKENAPVWCLEYRMVEAV